MHIKDAFNMKDLFTLNHDIHGDFPSHTLHVYQYLYAVCCFIVHVFVSILLLLFGTRNAIINKGIDNIYVEWKSKK